MSSLHRHSHPLSSSLSFLFSFPATGQHAHTLVHENGVHLPDGRVPIQCAGCHQQVSATVRAPALFSSLSLCLALTLTFASPASPLFQLPDLFSRALSVPPAPAAVCATPPSLASLFPLASLLLSFPSLAFVKRAARSRSSNWRTQFQKRLRGSTTGMCRCVCVCMLYLDGLRA